MKQFVVLFALVALNMGAPAEETLSKRSAPAVEYKEERDENGYNMRYVTLEGTIVSEHARLIPSADGKGKVLVSDGEVSYVGPDGKTYVTKWSAGLDGTKVEGAHLPVAPEPMPVPVVAEAETVLAPVAVEAAPAVMPAAIPAAPVLPQSEVIVLAY